MSRLSARPQASSARLRHRGRGARGQDVAALNAFTRPRTFPRTSAMESYSRTDMVPSSIMSVRLATMHAASS